MNQREFINKFNNENRLPFNDRLFERDEDEIIIELMKVILSAQRDQVFQIHVNSFHVTEDYNEINRILAEYTNETEKNKKKKELNEYEYVNLKETYAKLLSVNYIIGAKGEKKQLTVHILVPRIVDKYYFKIAGNMWFAMLQIVDGSTYNNSLTNNPKKQNITCKVVMPIRLFKNFQIYTDVNDEEEFECLFYTSNVFTRTLPMFKYILAKYGYIGTQKFTGIHSIYFTNAPTDNHNEYCVLANNDVYVNVPKYLFDNDHVTQSLFFTIVKSISECKKPTIARVMTNEFWLESLGYEFKAPTVKKGLELLASLESTYDITTKEMINLDDYSKRNIYSVLLWLAREFNKLRTKDNLDVSLKRIRYGQYIASLYSMKIINGLKRLSDIKNKVELQSIVRAIKTKPTFLLDAICKCNLINYRNLVNDSDAFLGMKYSYKGVSGIGDNNNKSIPVIYRHVHPSQLGILDTDSSPKSDPGISGVLCPTVKLYDNMYFSDYKEPNEWSEEYAKILEEYKELSNKKDVLIYQKNSGIPVFEDELSIIEKNLNSMKNKIDVLIYETKDPRLEKFKQITDLGGAIYFD